MKTKKTAWIVQNKEGQCLIRITGNSLYAGDVMDAYLFWKKEDAFKMVADLGVNYWNAAPVDVTVRLRSDKK